MSIMPGDKHSAVLCLQYALVLAVDCSVPGGGGLCRLVGEWSMEAIAVSVLLHVPRCREHLGTLHLWGEIQ